MKKQFDDNINKRAPTQLTMLNGIKWTCRGKARKGNSREEIQEKKQVNMKTKCRPNEEGKKIIGKKKRNYNLLDQLGLGKK